MNDYVELHLKKNRTWPWPEDSFGLTPMFGEEGWCRSCGVPKREQHGPLILQARKQSATGAWVPYWQYDIICVEARLGIVLCDRFGINLREVEWRGTAPGPAFQLVIPVGAEPWYDPKELAASAEARHGTTGAECPECSVWRWMPLVPELMPPRRWIPGADTPPVVASPEWFGDGLNSFRLILLRRDLAETIAKTSPRDFETYEEAI